jgi:hypothetical protein
MKKPSWWGKPKKKRHAVNDWKYVSDQNFNLGLFHGIPKAPKKYKKKFNGILNSLGRGEQVKIK